MLTAIHPDLGLQLFIITTTHTSPTVIERWLTMYPSQGCTLGRSVGLPMLLSSSVGQGISSVVVYFHSVQSSSSFQGPQLLSSVPSLLPLNVIPLLLHPILHVCVWLSCFWGTHKLFCNLHKGATETWISMGIQALPAAVAVTCCSSSG